MGVCELNAVVSADGSSRTKMKEELGCGGEEDQGGGGLW